MLPGQSALHRRRRRRRVPRCAWRTTPSGLPDSLLGPALDPLANLVLRYARTCTFCGYRLLVQIRAGRSLPSRHCSCGSRRKDESWKASSGREVSGANGRIPMSFACCAAARSRSSGRRSSRSIRPRSADSRRRGSGVLESPPRPEAVLDVRRTIAGRSPAGINPRNGNPARANRGMTIQRIWTPSPQPESHLGWGRASRGARWPRSALYLADHLTSLAAASPGSETRDGRHSRSRDAIVEYLKSHGAIVLWRAARSELAAVIRRTPSTPCGISLGEAGLPTTRFMLLRAFAQVRPALHRRQKRRSAPDLSLAAFSPAVCGRTVERVLPVAQAVRPVHLARGSRRALPTTRPKWAAAMAQQTPDAPRSADAESLAPR